MMLAYEEFIDTKRVSHSASGFVADVSSFDWLKPFQKHVVELSARRGKNAALGGTGTGKTRMELALATLCVGQTNKPSIVATQLGVTGQMIEEGKLVGVDVCRFGEGNAAVQVINFDKIQLVTPSDYGCICLDESSCLKDFTSARKKLLCAMFRETPYRFPMSATPAPNDYTELASHAEFLGVMSREAMLARWFVHDSENTSEWRMKGHAEGDFWRWVASWAIAFRKPSDIGPSYSDDGYILPPLNLHRKVVETEPEPVDGQLIPDARLSSTTIHAAMRKTAPLRAQAVADLIAEQPEEPWLVWCDSDDDAKALMKVLDGFVEVHGQHKDTLKESRLLGFAHGEHKRLLTKPSIAAHGLNLQVCARTAFVGPSFSFERVYQALRRFWRFGQTRDVHAWIFSADSEWNVLSSFDAKVKKHEESVDKMIAAMKAGDVHETDRQTREDYHGAAFRLLFGDNVKRIKDIPDSSVGYVVTSPPFVQLMVYSDMPEDMGNCANDAEFFDHLGFLVPEIKRVLMPGRLISLHCMDLPSTKERDGVIGLRDFPGELIRLFCGDEAADMARALNRLDKRRNAALLNEDHARAQTLGKAILAIEDDLKSVPSSGAGFIFHSRVTIWKDPLVAMQRTKAIGLLHKQLCKDSSISRQGIADYLITMRAPGANPEPISHGAGFDRYIGLDEPVSSPTTDAKTNKYGHEVWQRYASPVWMDIDQGDVLPYAGARETKDERHVCPLQLQVIERGIELWSNPGDLVLDPFNGVGSTGYVALRNGRKYVGLELKPTYFDQSIKNINRATGSIQPSIEGLD